MKKFHFSKQISYSNKMIYAKFLTTRFNISYYETSLVRTLDINLQSDV